MVTTSTLNIFRFIVLTTLLITILMVGGCRTSDDNLPEPLLIFCGITMSAPVRELADEFEKQHNITVKITYGGSQDLAKSIEVNKLGDIFLPGFKSFVENMAAHGHVDKSATVGYNQLSLFVAKGNPKNLTGDLQQLLNPQLAVIIGHEDLGSVGKESKRVLSELGIYDRVVHNTVFMASDSKGITAAIRSKKADIALNWRAVASLKGNKDFVDVVTIKNADPKELVMASLRYSRNSKLANDFLALCSSEHGLNVFKKYGF